MHWYIFVIFAAYNFVHSDQYSPQYEKIKYIASFLIQRSFNAKCLW